MAISLGKFKQAGQQMATSERLAAEYAKQKKKAGKRYDSIKEDGRLRREIEVWKRDNIDTLDIIR